MGVNKITIMKKIWILFLLLLMTIAPVKAQGFGYDSKDEIGDGLYKVKSGQYYGIIDDEDNVVVSVEYQDILYRNGKALLTKNNILYGVVDSLGKVVSFDPKYKIHPQFKYIYDGYIIVGDSKWGYLSEDGEPLFFNTKSKGTFIFQKKSFMIFDDAYPFVDGLATVFFKKIGWKHIDKNGKERFVLNNKKNVSEFRSSIYKDECIIVTGEGIKQYQENDERHAVVKRILSTSASGRWNIIDVPTPKIFYNEGTLVLDSLMRVEKFETKNDSIVFIEKPKPVIVETLQFTTPADTLSARNNMYVDLMNRSIQANGKGKAYTEIRIANKSTQKFESLTVSLKCGTTTREWKGALEGSSEIHLSLNIPATFSTSQIKRNVIVHIEYKDENVEYEFPLIIKRYTPIRSR